MSIIDELDKEQGYEEFICVICKDEIIGYGNNAQPLKDGLCCDDCNIQVIKERIKIERMKLWQ